jgi:hypothetical protein
MKLLLVTIIACIAIGGTAQADRWDSKGWTKLGERDVDRKVDRDRIPVGRYEGKFAKLTLVVENSDLDLLDFEVTFGNGEKFHPEVRHFFKEGARTRVIDLPGDDRVIQSIDLKYKNLPGGGKAKVEVWGWKSGDVAKRAPWRFESKGWTLLGERVVNFRVDHDRIPVGKHKGKFSKLSIVVLDSDLELLDFDVKFAKGASFHPEVKHVFKEGQRSRAIDFPGDERAIKNIEVKYKNMPGGGKARVQIWAQ